MKLKWFLIVHRNQIVELISSSFSIFDILNGDDGVQIISDCLQKLDCDLLMSSVLILDTADEDDFKRNFVGSDPKVNYNTQLLIIYLVH